MLFKRRKPRAFFGVLCCKIGFSRAIAVPGDSELGDPGGGEGKWLRRTDEALPSAIRVDDGWGWIGLTRL
jgi:hypothetical protein